MIDRIDKKENMYFFHPIELKDKIIAHCHMKKNGISLT